jgi:coproporphyrinogen III oxidase-like Fe-S oxidoreductase
MAKSSDEVNALLSAFKRANLTYINIGLESGSERIRKEILNRPDYTNADLISFCKAAKKAGIQVSLFVLIGLPTETTADYLSTAAIARDCEPSALSESIFYPYPGTKLFDLAADMCLFDPATIDTTAERSRAYLELKGFPQWRINFEYVFVTWRVFHGRVSLSWLMKRMAYKALGMKPGLLTATLRLRTAFPGR